MSARTPIANMVGRMFADGVPQKEILVAIRDAERTTCDHCGGIGELIDLSVAGDPYRVHKHCLDVFLAPEIPRFRGRRTCR